MAPVAGPAGAGGEGGAVLRAALDEAERQAVELARAHVSVCVRCDSYGRDDVKRFGLSPDAWAQMALQLAWDMAAAPADRVPAVYEPAHTRKFGGGRTETIRGVSLAAREWVRAMRAWRQTTVHEARAHLAPQLHKLLQRACVEHAARSDRASNAMGVDRHLFGLRMAAEANGAIPGRWEHALALLRHPLVARSARWVVSTSNLSAPIIENWGWGQVEDDGVGIAYSCLPAGFHFNLVSRRDCALPAAVRGAFLPRDAGFCPISRAEDGTAHAHPLANSLADYLPAALRDMHDVVHFAKL